MYKLLQKGGNFMTKKIENIKDLAWSAFCETGEIGAYMLYKKLSEEENYATNDNARGGAPHDRL